MANWILPKCDIEDNYILYYNLTENLLINGVKNNKIHYSRVETDIIDRKKNNATSAKDFF